MKSASWTAVIARIFAVLLVIWGIGVAFIAHAMRQPPEKFARAMKHVPVRRSILRPLLLDRKVYSLALRAY